MKRYVYKSLTATEIKALVQRPGGDFSDILSSIKVILEEVSAKGEDALKHFTLQFDGIQLQDLRVSEREFGNVHHRIDSKTKQAIFDAADAIRAYHCPQVPQPIEIETRPGVTCRLEWRPIQRVGLYIPGGSAPLISTVLMLGIPARIAGCEEIILCTPPSSKGMVAAEIVFAADTLGIKNVFNIGGAQAIAAMALGTSSIPKVDKIFGPGNRFVTAMKSLIARPPYNVTIDLLAGPTELLIIADEIAKPQWIAADLLSQAEHGGDSHVVLVTTSPLLAERVEQEISKQLSDLPRCVTARQALNNSFILLVRDLDEAIEFSNHYAPEHLILAVTDPDSLASKVKNAGSVFLGSMSSVVFGDYASGTNHTLPTGGLAAAVGGITVGNFMKPIFFQTISPKGLRSLATTVTTLARAERLEGHVRAVEI
ncbi:MAG: histidinol dehydrogenase, partial [Ignavibacteriales bacterium]|nr:histidinol dehydrogenase [Ignavibacteriales bacterium]